MTRRSVFPILRDASVVALITMFALALAYQVRSRVLVDIGGKWDAPFVARFFDAEGDTEQTYRWTHSESRVELDGQNLATPWTMRVRVNGYRPTGTVNVDVKMNGTAVAEFQAHDGWDIYESTGTVAADAWNGNNTVVLANETFVPQKVITGSTDPRKLGVAADWLELIPARSTATIGNDDYWLDLGGAPILPPMGVLLSWGAAFGLIYGTARGIGLSKRAVNPAFAIFILALALGFAFARPYLGYYSWAFLLLALMLGLLGSMLGWLVPRFAAHLGMRLERTHLALLCGIVLLSVGLKWGGAWYPQFQSSDLLFHVHRLEFVSRGQIFFTSELPDAARRVVPYPPALYVALAPFTLFGLDFSALLIALNGLVDALAILGIYFAARAIVQKREDMPDAARVALFASFLAAFNPVAFWIYSWGNHTNIFGQAVATILFCVVLTQRVARPRNFLLLLFLFILAAVSHLGVFLSLLAFFPPAIVLVFLLRDETTRRESGLLLGLFVVGLVLVSLLYYAEFSDVLLAQTRKFIADFGAGRAAAAQSTSILERVSNVARYTWEQIGWVLLLGGFAGAPLVWKYFSRRAVAIWGAWLLVGILFGLVTLGASFSTRYTLWAAPALALSGGLFLAWLIQKALGMQYVVYVLCAGAFAQTLWLWVDRVWNGYH